MGSIVAENRKSLMLFSGRGFPELAQEIGKTLGIAPTPSDSYEFANGEIFVRFKESVRGSDAFVVQSITEGVNRWVMETLIMVDALKRGSAKRITVCCRSTRTRGRTRSTAAGSRSPPGWWRTC